MKKIGDILFSNRLMAIVLAFFAVSIAVATFIENDFGSTTARALVYNSTWFELLLFIGMINLTGIIIRKKLYTRPRLSLFAFHLSFVLILAGAAITRFTGFEGSLTLMEGESSDRVLTEGTYLVVKSGNERFEFPVFANAAGRRGFKDEFRIGGRSYSLICKSLITNAIPDIVPDPDGKPMASLVYTDSEGRKGLILGEGEKKQAGSAVFAFSGTDPDTQAVRIFMRSDSLVFQAPYQVQLTNMTDQSARILPAREIHRLYPLQLYTFRNTMVVMNKFFPGGRRSAGASYGREGRSADALLMELSSGGESKEFTLWGNSGYAGEDERVSLNNEEFLVSYGSVKKKIPFTLKLNDFIVERYPGSNSPSWFESRVQLSDPSRNLSENRRIYMNNILKYRGYRFYQSSYTSDEKGTILSVNRDWAGTWVTYVGYLVMGLGMLLSLFNRNSRFQSLTASNALLKEAKKALVLLALFFLPAALPAQESRQPEPAVADPGHARLFGRMLVQDNAGRIEPVNTLSSEILRKLSRKNAYKGMTSDQVVLGMLTDPASWQHEPIIRATHPQIREIMGSGSGYYSFVSFFPDGNYILHDYVENAFRKKSSMRSKFDNEVIRLDERINISYMVFTGDLLRILPVPGDSTHTWQSANSIRGKVNSADSSLIGSLIPMYIQEVRASLASGDWTGPDEIIRNLTAFQARVSGDVVPSPRKISLEIFLNRSDIFPRISKVYGSVGFLLLLLQFIGLFYTRFRLKIPEMIALTLVGAAFLMHSAGLGLRWYVSGHAPWSNGYEALTYIAWATVLAGLIFYRRSSIALSATAILAFLILHTAHLSWMDPQITNLVPVLKSYWLVIHVATITASYGFLGLGALMAFINLLLMILVARKSFGYIDLTIRELTNIIEMTLIIGLYLLTIGTFLGGVWANESWGRYWGWDPKETWALVTVLIYAFILHMRMVPGLRGLFGFNLAALIGYSSVIMTYFGVNYYLSGLHSYAKGDPLPVPPFVYYTLAVVFVTSLSAFLNYRKLTREMNGLTALP